MVMAAILVAIGLGAGMISSANAGTDYQGVGIVKVDSPAEVPADAELYSVSSDGCATTTTWRLIVPGNDQTSHQEFRYKRDVPATEEQSHMEYKYKKEVSDYTTKWHIEKVYAEDVYKDHWYSYNPGRDKEDDDPTTGPIDKDNGWQGDNGNHNGLYDDPNFALNTPWQSAGGNGAWWYVDREISHHAGDIYPGHGGDVISDTEPTVFHGRTIGVPFEIAGMMFKYVITGHEQVQSGSHFVYTDWTTDVLDAPWIKVDERKVVDVEAVPGYTEYFVLDGEPSQNEADASWILAEQLPLDQGWVQFDERTVVDTEETPDVITDYVYNDEKKCDTPKPPKHHTPNAPDKPGVPTVIDAGL
jgi:hypothetical protein